MNEKYLNVLQKLYKTNRFKKRKVDLETITKACQLFNNPQNNLNHIHVTGTNGKGSVCKKLASTFTKSGMKTGLFISPHISSFRERIQIDDKMIEKEYIVEELERIYTTCDKNNCDLTYFEIVTLLCFNYYRDKKIDVGVIEVGLGGNLDATNVVDPLLSIITSIGMDHMDSLGFTQRDIAEKKAGIIKLNRPVLIGVDCNPKDVFYKMAKEMNSELFTCDDGMKLKNKPLSTHLFNRDFEKENNNLVINAVNILQKHYPQIFSKISSDDLNFGISQKQPCRKEDVLQNISKEQMKNLLASSNKNLNIDFSKIKKIYLDVAHNSHAMQKLLPKLKEEHPKDKLHLICGFSSNKDKDELFKIISSYADRIYLTDPNHPRTTNYKDLCEELRVWLLNYNYNPSLYFDIEKIINYKDKQNENEEDEIINKEKKYKGEVKEAILKCMSECEKDTVIVICGTFFIMKDARKTLGYYDEDDPVELNEINPIKFNI